MKAAVYRSAGRLVAKNTPLAFMKPLHIGMAGRPVKWQYLSGKKSAPFL